MQNLVLGTGHMLLNKDELYLFRILRITALTAIRYLKRQKSPVLNDWLGLVSKVHSMKIITDEIRSKRILFEKIWAPLK